MKLVYTGIRVTNLKKSMKFYTRALGLRVSHKGYMHHGGQFVNLVDKATGQHLELNWYPKRSVFYRSYRSGEELDHIGFQVEDARESFSQLVSKDIVRRLHILCNRETFPLLKKVELLFLRTCSYILRNQF